MGAGAGGDVFENLYSIIIKASLNVCSVLMRVEKIFQNSEWRVITFK